MRYLICSILPMCFMSADTATATGAATASSGGPATGTKIKGGPAPAVSPTVSPVAKATPEPKIHDKLLTSIKSYDDAVQKAESYYVEIIELVLTEKINRADTVATIMKARGVTFETAQSQYTRMKKMWEQPEILQKLKDGEITLKIAREATKSTRGEIGTSTATPGAPAPSGEASKETKEARYERVQKAHISAVKECGFDLKSALLSFESGLKAAGVK